MPMQKNKISDLMYEEKGPCRSKNLLTRSLLKAVDEEKLNNFKQAIHQNTDALLALDVVAAHHDTLRKFLDKFDQSFNLWKGLISQYETIPNYDNAILDLLNLGMWRYEYANDPQGRLTPFGPTLSMLGEALGGDPIGVLHGLIQQSCGFYSENLGKAQKLAVEMYNHFLGFCDSNQVTDLKSDKEDPPVVQLYSNGAVTYLKDFPVPTIIALSETNSVNFGKLTALPHEFGHDISGTFEGAQLVGDMENKIDTLDIPHKYYWKLWTEEIFADSVGIMIIREGEIYSLANLFTSSYTNLILRDETEDRADEHPNRHIRILLAIEVGRILGIDETILDDMKKRWNEFGEKVNNSSLADYKHIYDQFSGKKFPMSEFVDGIVPVARAVVDTPYGKLKNHSLRDVFAGFQSDLAEEMITKTDRSMWTDNA